MRRWILYGTVLSLISLLNVTGFVGTDVGEIQPVQAVMAVKEGNMVRLQTDTGDTGVGINPNSALKDMQEHAVGKLFLETADYLILQAGCEEMLPALSEMLRPSCKVCVLIGCADPQKAAEYLVVHEPDLSLRDWLGGESEIPELMEREGRLMLVS